MLEEDTPVWEHTVWIKMIDEFIASSYLTPSQSWTFLLLFGYITWRFIR